MDLDALNTRLAAVQAAYSDVKNNAESFPEGDTPTYYYEGMAAQLAEAEQAAESAGTFYNGAVAAKNAAETAQGDAVAAKNAAVAAKTAAETAQTAAESASGIAVDAKDAAVAAAELAETKVEGAAQVGESNEFTGNNTFSATSTFNGSLVANDSLLAVGSLTYKSQELNNLLSYPIVAQLMAAGINPASALATSWDQWVSMNPNWLSLDDLLFYAPLITDAVGSDLPENTNSPFKSSTFISPAHARTIASAHMFGKKVKYFTWRGGTNHEVFDCYYVVDCEFYAPNATTLGTALNAIGYSNSGTLLSLHVYIPSVTSISTAVHGSGSTFWRIGLLKEFSIYAPKLVNSFSFSRSTASKIGQTCAILQALIDGIGTPGTVQTITTLTPSDGDETVDGGEQTKKDILREKAAAKNWKFIIPAKDAEGNDITIDL